MVQQGVEADRAWSTSELRSLAPDGGRILVTTLATFDHEAEAHAFIRGLRGVEVLERERMPRDLEALERHGLVPTTAPEQP